MNEKEIFEMLFAEALRSKDPRGVVAACIIDDGEVLALAASGDDGYSHAEDIMLAELANIGMNVPPTATLYATLEPCSRRTDPRMLDCVTQIISSRVMHVVFGARDPKQSDDTQKRLAAAGISLRQISDPAIIARCAETFNNSVTPDHIGVDVDLKPTD